MKKLIVLLSIVTIITTGCSVIKLDDKDVSININTLMSEKVRNYNVYYDGYKYYLPKGVSFIDKENLLSDAKVITEGFETLQNGSLVNIAE